MAAEMGPDINPTREGSVQAEAVFVCLDRLWARLADTRRVNHLEIHMEDGTRLFDEIRVFDNTPAGDFGLEREVHYFNTIGRITEYRADIVAEQVYLSVSVSLIGRASALGGYHMDPAELSPAEAGQLDRLMERLALADWAPAEDQAEAILGGLGQAG